MKKQSSPEIMMVGRLMFELLRVLKKRNVENAEIKITNEQVGLLHALSQQSEEVIQKDMAEVMGKDKSAILRLVDSLEEKELVRRVVDKNDRRKNYLVVTKKGERVLELYIKIVDELMKELEQGLHKSEIDTFYKVVTHFQNNVEKL
jgi:MarR family transcriptional regulator, transcriptional regulator for hemolysin